MPECLRCALSWPENQQYQCTCDTSQTDDANDSGEPSGPDFDAEFRQWQEHRDKVDRHLRELRAREEAKRRFDAEQHASTWQRPVEYDTLADELALPRRPVTYRVEKLFPAGGNVTLTAQFKAGKTTLVNNLVKALADDQPFLGRYEVHRIEGRVGVFNYEVDADQYRDWLRDMGIVHTERVSLYHLRGHRLPLTMGDAEEFAVDWLKRRDVSVWVLDPFARAMVGCGDENSNADVGVFLDTLDRIKMRAGVQELIMPLHTGRAIQARGEERSRGASRADDWTDVRWVLTKDADGRRYLRCDGRDVDQPEQALTYDTTTRALTIGAGAGSRQSTQRSGLRMDAVAWLAKHPGSNVKEVCVALEKRREEVSAVLKSSVAEGYLRTDPGPRSSKLHYVTDRGMDLIGQSTSDHSEPPWLDPNPAAPLW